MTTESTEAQAVAKGVEHLQVAAREMIAAARAFLDVVEELVNDPDKVGEVVDAVSTVASTVTDAARRTAGSTPSRSAKDGPTGSGSSDSSDDRVQRIRVS
jgi:hypothetical protein